MRRILRVKTAEDKSFDTARPLIRSPSHHGGGIHNTISGCRLHGLHSCETTAPWRTVDDTRIFYCEFVVDCQGGAITLITYTGGFLTACVLRFLNVERFALISTEQLTRVCVSAVYIRFTACHLVDIARRISKTCY